MSEVLTPRATWAYVLYDLKGLPITQLKDVRDASIRLKLNDIDEFSFSMSLTNEHALRIVPLQTVVKVYRQVRWTDEKGKAQLYAPTDPVFAGVVGPITESGSAETFSVTCFSPLWRLKYRHHRDGTTKSYNNRDKSRIFSGLLSYTNVKGDTGIIMGSMATTAVIPKSPIEPARNIWDYFSGTLLGSNDGIDIRVAYPHTDGVSTLARVDTYLTRGVFRGAAAMHYRIGTNNLADLERVLDVDNIATWVTVQGKNAPTATTPESGNGVHWSTGQMDKIGLYEMYLDRKQDVSDLAYAEDLARALVARLKKPQSLITPTQAVGVMPIFGKDYDLGDVLPIYGYHGRMRVADTMRLTEVTLGLSSEDQETTRPVFVDPPVHEDSNVPLIPVNGFLGA